MKMAEDMISQETVPSIDSLMKERDAMRRRISELESTQSSLMSTCRSLAATVETRDGPMTKTVVIPRAGSGNGLNNDTAKLMVRCADLERALQEAREKNSDTDKDKIISELTLCLHEKKNGRSSLDPAQHQEQLDRLVSGYKGKVATAEEKQATAELELGRLRQHFMAFIEKLQQENGSLQAEQAALKAQLLTYEADFRQEQSERCQAQARQAQLEQELDHIHIQLQQFQTAELDVLQRKRTAGLSSLQQEYAQLSLYGYDIPPAPRAAGRLISHGAPRGVIVADGDDAPPALRCDEDIIDVPLACGGLSLPRDDDDDLLHCPKCNRGYTTEDHEVFLDHIDQCC